MTKKQKAKTKKITKQVKKAYKKKPKAFIALSIILICILIGAFAYLYLNGYLDSFLFPDKQEKPVYSVFEQNEEGFYYYNESGYNLGEYYASTKDLVGNALASELHTILNQNFTPVSYGDARYVLAYSDRDPQNNNESVRGIYDNDVISTNWIGTGAGAWQREHVWPNSKLGVERVDNSSKNKASDLHNLWAITGINQSRSNRYFVDGSGDAKTVGTDGFYPGDDHKGDVARILFYMVIMYDDLQLTNDISKLVDNSSTNYKPEGAYAGLFDLLIKWHKEDPVDEFEFQRNQFIYDGIALNSNGKEIKPQGNRNPFIDKPEFVHLIWEEKQIEDLIKPLDVVPDLYQPNSNNLIFFDNKDNEWLD